MKKIRLILAMLLIALFFTFAAGSGESSTTDQGSGSASATEKNENILGDYEIIIDSCRIAEDYEGKPVVIVKYIFKNVSDDNATAFYLAISDTVYQNGVGLNEAYVLADSANYNSDNQTKEIKKGSSIEVERAYELNDTTTEIEVEVEEFIGFSDKTIVKKFSIA